MARSIVIVGAGIAGLHLGLYLRAHDVPVTIYFVVAAGWLCLLCWSFVSGQFKDVEEPKYEMLRLEEEYERRGE